MAALLSPRVWINTARAQDTTIFNSYWEEWLAFIPFDHLLELDGSNETIGYEKSIAIILERIRSALEMSE